MTFKQCAEAYVEAHRAAWRNDKHAWQWDQTLRAHVYPMIGALPVAIIDTGNVTRILEPLWKVKTETASRIRGRIEAVLDYAKVHGWRTGENPARWKGHLENVLPSPNKVARIKHHAALPWQETGTFMSDLEKQGGVSALALRFTILTAARTSEVINARWSEIDMSARLWTVPGERMKAGREHRVPLSEAALAVLRAVWPPGDDRTGWVFPGPRAGQPLSNMAMLALLRRTGHGHLTTHGFRSSFRDWCGETGKANDIVEAALAHTLGNKVQAAYQRGDLLERRRTLMDQWAAFCARPAAADVVPLHRAASGGP
jgi:integrase